MTALPMPAARDGLRRATRIASFCAALALCLVGPTSAQEPAPAEAPAPAAETAPPKPKPRPKPKPKPAPKAEAPAPDRMAVPSEPAPLPASLPKSEPLPESKPKPKSAAPFLPAAKTEPPTEKPSETSQIAPPRAAFTGPAIACDPGQSVLYDGAKDISLWVTRSGTVTVNNPLRPLTPEVTRVLQIVIGGKLATAYGPDLNEVRRGGPPAMLEAALGGPIRWDAALGTLPDALDIVADSGATLAALRFKECGEAPAVKASTVAKAKRDDKPKQARKQPPTSSPGSAPSAAIGLRPAADEPQRRLNLPQGAISE